MRAFPRTHNHAPHHGATAPPLHTPAPAKGTGLTTTSAAAPPHTRHPCVAPVAQQPRRPCTRVTPVEGRSTDMAHFPTQPPAALAQRALSNPGHTDDPRRHSPPPRRHIRQPRGSDEPELPGDVGSTTSCRCSDLPRELRGTPLPPPISYWWVVRCGGTDTPTYLPTYLPTNPPGVQK